MKNCIQCQKPIESKRKKYCSDHCKYWYNHIKKYNERDMAPVRKRTEKWFFMVTGSTWNSRGQGKRMGGTIKGAMSAMVRHTVESLVEVNEENVRRHFKGIPGYLPNYMRLGTEEKVFVKDIYERFGFTI